MRIACIVANMGPGGAQRAMSHLCNYFVGNGHEVTLMLLQLPGEVLFFPLDKRIRLAWLGRSGTGVITKALRVAKWLTAIRRAVSQERPDVVISFIDRTNIMVLFATRGLGLPVVVSERVDPNHYNIGRASCWLRRVIYPFAKRLVVQTERAARYFASYPRDKLVVLPNPIFPAKLVADPMQPSPSGRFRIIGVGRLDPQKGYDLLIVAFAALARRFRDWDVTIFGSGPEHTRLTSMIEAMLLRDRIHLMPPTQRIDAELAASHVFAFPSRFEGFPNALGEAMAAGLPCTAFQGVSGVEDLIVDGESGLLGHFGGNDDTAIASLKSNLEQLITDAELRAHLGKAAISRVTAYAPAKMLSEWTNVITGVIANCTPGPARALGDTNQVRQTAATG